MFFTRMQKAHQTKAGKRIHVYEYTSSRESMQDICTRGKGKKLLDPLKERYRIGKKWKKDYRPHRKPQARRDLKRLQLTGEP